MVIYGQNYGQNLAKFLAIILVTPTTLAIGDGWSTIARPLFEAAPWTAGIFVILILTMVVGVMNLITAVI